MSEILDNIYIWVFSINSESALLLDLLKYMLCSHFTQNCTFCTVWRLKILALWRKIVENLLIFLYLFCIKNGVIDFTKTFITQEWLTVESCPTPRWITFLMLYLLVCNIRSYFNYLISAWSAYQYDQVGPGTPKFLSGTRDQGLRKKTLINNLAAWKIEWCNESIDILLEN